MIVNLYGVGFGDFIPCFTCDVISHVGHLCLRKCIFRLAIFARHIGQKGNIVEPVVVVACFAFTCLVILRGAVSVWLHVTHFRWGMSVLVISAIL